MKFQSSSILLIFLISSSITNSYKIIINFEDKACEEKLISLCKEYVKTNNIEEECLDLEIINTFIVDNSIYNHIKDNEELKKCITTINKDQELMNIEPLQSKSFLFNRYSWHLSRINMKTNTFSFGQNSERRFIQPDSVNTHVFIFDTGVDGSHYELSSKLSSDPNQHYNAIYTDTCCQEKTNALCDCNGHGTHVAGLVASNIAGYNPKATIHSIKVLSANGKGTDSSLLIGINNALRIKARYFPNELTIFNMSLGFEGSHFQIIRTINTLQLSGVIPVVAAGNDNQDSCKFTPSQATAAVTVGATDRFDYRSDFSNYGSCVDIFAPGTNIFSTYPNNKYMSLNGTSMAAPIVSGFISALGAQLRKVNPQEVIQELFKRSVSGVVKNSLSEKNYFIYDGI